MAVPTVVGEVTAAENRSRSWRLSFELLTVVFVFAALAVLLAPISRAPATFVDSGNILAIARPVLSGDLGPVVQTQSPPLQSGLYAAAMAAGSWFPMHAIPVGFSFALALFLAFVVYRETKSGLLALLPVLFLAMSRVFWLQTGSLALYPAFILFGYAGLYLGGRYVLREELTVWTGGLGAVLLAAALYTSGQALPYMVIPALFFVLSRNETTARRLAGWYGLLVLLLAPWLVWHFAVGGIEHFYYYPLSWLPTEYQPYIDAFWGRDYSLGLEYVLDMGHVAYKILPWWAWIFAPIGLGHVWKMYGWEAAVFVIGVLLVFSVPIFLTRPTGLARYWYSILPTIVLLCSAGAAHILLSIRNVQIVAIAVAVGAVWCSLVAAGEARAAYEKNVFEVEHSEYYADFKAVAEVIDDDRGIIGRDAKMQTLVPGNQMYNNILMSESDFVTYLAWPSDSAVRQVLEEHDIGWVLLYKDKRWEHDYNFWLNFAYGLEPQHYKRIGESPYFDEVYDGEVYRLYRLRPAPRGARTGPGVVKALP